MVRRYTYYYVHKCSSTNLVTPPTVVEGLCSTTEWAVDLVEVPTNCKYGECVGRVDISIESPFTGLQHF